jgi:vacuolar-type H+-ATPase subunit H
MSASTNASPIIPAGDLFGAALRSPILDKRPRNMADVVLLQKALGVKNRKDLLGMSAKRDPFNAGGPADERDAHWFLDQWNAQGFSGATGVHLRKLHYRIVVLGDKVVKLPRQIEYTMDGKKCTADYYENLDAVWAYLTEAGAKARYLKLVPPDAFVDQRNPPPLINSQPFWTATPSWFVCGCDRWQLPTIHVDLAGEMAWELPCGYVDGYDYGPGNQPYLVEVWCEKNTMDEVLKPLCEKHGANYVTAKGFQSITAAINILQRAKQHGMATRILYVSDFDPAGEKMPPAVARQIEFWFEQFAPGVDVKINSIVLTLEQAKHYKLPTVPIKDSDKRAAQFLERYGVKGAVELDALDTLHPGELDRIIEEAICAYRDIDLASRLNDAERTAQRELDEVLNPARHAAAQILGEIRTEAQKILQRYEGQLRELSEELALEFAPLQDQLDTLREQLDGELEQVKLELPERPEAEITPPDESGWLFDSSRDYLNQLQFYKPRHAAANDEITEEAE